MTTRYTTTLAIMLALAGTVPALAAENEAVSDPSVKVVEPQALAKGENSFTESQARNRFEEAGFTNISNLMLDEDGIWRAVGKTNRDDRRLSLDFKGDVSAE